MGGGDELLLDVTHKCGYFCLRGGGTVQGSHLEGHAFNDKMSHLGVCMSVTLTLCVFYRREWRLSAMG